MKASVTFNRMRRCVASRTCVSRWGMWKASKAQRADYQFCVPSQWPSFLPTWRHRRSAERLRRASCTAASHPATSLPCTQLLAVGRRAGTTLIHPPAHQPTRRLHHLFPRSPLVPLHFLKFLSGWQGAFLYIKKQESFTSLDRLHKALRVLLFFFLWRGVKGEMVAKRDIYCLYREPLRSENNDESSFFKAQF